MKRGQLHVRDVLWFTLLVAIVTFTVVQHYRFRQSLDVLLEQDIIVRQRLSKVHRAYNQAQRRIWVLQSDDRRKEDEQLISRQDERIRKLQEELDRLKATIQADEAVEMQLLR